MVDVSLLPKEEKEPTKQTKEQKIEVRAKSAFPTNFLVIGVLIVFIAAGLTVGIFVYQKARASTLRGLENQISNLQTEESKYTAMENQANVLQAQLDNLSNLVNKHTYWSQVIKALADYTPTNISYKSITFSQTDNKFIVIGYSDNYESIARLMASLKKMDSKEYFDSIELVSAKLGVTETNEVKIQFSISFNLKEGALKKTTTTNKK